MSARSETAFPPFRWHAPGAPGVIFPRHLMEGIHNDVMKAFASIPRRGAETGGILLGKRKGADIAIVDFEPIPCEHRFGPSYRLSDGDRQILEETLAWLHAGGHPGLEVVGFYRSHTRPQFGIDAEDEAMAGTHFAENGNLFLLIQPMRTQASLADFFLVRGGRIEEASKPQPFPFAAGGEGSRDNSPAASPAAPDAAGLEDGLRHVLSRAMEPPPEPGLAPPAPQPRRPAEPVVERQPRLVVSRAMARQTEPAALQPPPPPPVAEAPPVLPEPAVLPEPEIEPEAPAAVAAPQFPPEDPSRAAVVIPEPEPVPTGHLEEHRAPEPLPTHFRQYNTTTRLSAVRRVAWYWPAAAVLAIFGGVLGYFSVGKASRPAPVRIPAAQSGSTAPAAATAPQPAAPAPAPAATGAENASPDSAEIRSLLDRWTSAWRGGDAEAAAALYAPRVKTYLRRRNVSRDEVRRSMRQWLNRYGRVDAYTISSVSIAPGRGGEMIAKFRKRWQAGAARKFAGEEREQLTIARDAGKWQITSDVAQRVGPVRRVRTR